MLASLARRALATAAPAGADGCLSVLIYHRVLRAPDPLLPDEPTAGEFEQTMRWIRSTFNVIPLADGIAGLRDGRLPQRALAITFDDGYANNATLAAPILASLGLHATFFLATGYLDGGRMFNDTVLEAVRAAREVLDLQIIGLGRYEFTSDADRRAALTALLDVLRDQPPRERADLAERIADAAGAPRASSPMMTGEQAARLATDGFTLGAHTVNHPILARLADDVARDEILASRCRVEQLAGASVNLFAYPNGRPNRDYTPNTVRLVREAGFVGAVTTSPGAARVCSDPWQVPRFTPWDHGALRFAARMWNNAARVAPSYASAAA